MLLPSHELAVGREQQLTATTQHRNQALHHILPPKGVINLKCVGPSGSGKVQKSLIIVTGDYSYRGGVPQGSPSQTSVLPNQRIIIVTKATKVVIIFLWLPKGQRSNTKDRQAGSDQGVHAQSERQTSRSPSSLEAWRKVGKGETHRRTGRWKRARWADRKQDMAGDSKVGCQVGDLRACSCPCQVHWSFLRRR